MIAAVAAAAVGVTVWSSQPGGGDQFEFTVTADPLQVMDFIHQQHLPPATAQKLEDQAKKEELVIWTVTERASSGHQGQVYTMDNGVDRHQFAVNSQGQQFGMLAEKSTPGFSFTADANPSSARMNGTWHTPAGTTAYDMQPSQTMQIRVR